MEEENVLINVQLKRDVREDFRIAAKLKGATMSALLLQFIVQTIRDEKERLPQAFPGYVPPVSIPVETNQEFTLKMQELVRSVFGDEADPDVVGRQMYSLLTGIVDLSKDPKFAELVQAKQKK